MSDMPGVYASARAMAAAVREKRISARELLDLHLRRIERVNPDVNAVVALDTERAHKAAAAADERLAHGDDAGPLHGLPFAFKDTHAVAGWRTTYGSPLMRDHVPDTDDPVVARIRAAGVVPIGKTNTPEWAAGSHTFNPVYGTTLNPYDRTRSAGGSSGGAAAALASGMVPLADGSDMGGSLRNPASFCNVVGLRPSMGLVPGTSPHDTATELSVAGPMARSVSDLAFLLSAIADPAPGAPDTYAPPPDSDLRGVRVALSLDLGGAFEVDHAVASVIAAQSEVFAGAGAKVVDAHPHLEPAEQVFRTLRAYLFDAQFADLLAADPDGFKPSLADNIRAGASLTELQLAAARNDRRRLGERMTTFFADHDVLAMPVSQVPPFPAEQEYPADINGQPQHTYLDWMRSAYLVTATGCPAISVPAGFTEEGWPVGLQLVGPPNGERRLLQIAHAYERLTKVGERRPDL